MRRNTTGRIGRLALVCGVAVGLMAGCGGGSSHKTRSVDSPNAPQHFSVTARVTGVFSTDGRPTGVITCGATSNHDFQLHSTGVPKIAFELTSVTDGDIQVLDAYSVYSNRQHYPPGQTAVKTLTVEKGDNTNVNIYTVTSGTLTISGHGANGTFDGNAGIVGDETGQIHLLLTWKGCPAK